MSRTMWRLFLAVAADLLAKGAAGAAAAAVSPAAAGDALALLQGRVTAAAQEDGAEEGNETSTDPVRVLIFMAVGHSDETARRLQENVASLRNHRHRVHAKLFLAHYDFDQESWLRRDRAWYEQNVAFSVQRAGYKFKIAREVLPEHLLAHSYDWVWLLDEDVDFSRTDLGKLFSLASASKALLLQPALPPEPPPQNATLSYLMAKKAELQAIKMHERGQHGFSALQVESFSQVGRIASHSSRVGCQANEIMCFHLSAKTGAYQAGNSRACSFRYTNIVEVMATIARPRALMTIFEKCKGCMHKRALWGLDLMWCSWLARQYSREKSSTCAIVDQAPIRHDNQKTLGKWTKQGQRNMQAIHTDYWGAYLDVRDRYPEDFVPHYDAKTLRCIPP